MKASPTLFITNIPPGDNHLNLLEKTLRYPARLRMPPHLAQLQVPLPPSPPCPFPRTRSAPHTPGRAQPGFIPPMRIAKGGAIAFGDYDTAQQAYSLCPSLCPCAGPRAHAYARMPARVRVCRACGRELCVSRTPARPHALTHSRTHEHTQIAQGRRCRRAPSRQWSGVHTDGGDYHLAEA